jgi:hypothetical protein
VTAYVLIHELCRRRLLRDLRRGRWNVLPSFCRACRPRVKKVLRIPNVRAIDLIVVQ